MVQFLESGDFGGSDEKAIRKMIDRYEEALLILNRCIAETNSALMYASAPELVSVLRKKRDAFEKIRNDLTMQDARTVELVIRDYGEVE